MNHVLSQSLTQIIHLRARAHRWPMLALLLMLPPQFLPHSSIPNRAIISVLVSCFVIFFISSSGFLLYSVSLSLGMIDEVLVFCLLIPSQILQQSCSNLFLYSLGHFAFPQSWLEVYTYLVQKLSLCTILSLAYVMCLGSFWSSLSHPFSIFYAGTEEVICPLFVEMSERERGLA